MPNLENIEVPGIGEDPKDDISPDEVVGTADFEDAEADVAEDAAEVAAGIVEADEAETVAAPTHGTQDAPKQGGFWSGLLWN